MKAVKAKLQETNPDAVAAFEKGATAFAKKLQANFKDYEFVRTTLDAGSAVTDLLFAVHWREHEPGRHGRASELPRGWRHP